MIFSSIPFLYYFLPAVILLYYIIPARFITWKNAVLLTASLCFYAWGEPLSIIFMAASILQGYIFGILIEKFRERALSKIFLWLSVALSIGLLILFKYTGVTVKILGVSVGMPIGISFYTFQLLSYVADVSKGRVKAQRSLLLLSVYISMFPQLIAGPIVRYQDMEQQLKKRTHDLEKTAYGIRRLIFGLSKKVLIADGLAQLCASFKEADNPSIAFFWIYVIASSLQVYFDFSGYSDMAIGLGSIFGFHINENFRYPFVADSITDFWRRWHISLGRWFRDYVYIPLGGNRVSRLRWGLNILIVWGLTGIWHGNAWNFLLWGLYFGLLLILEKWVIGKLLDRIGGFRYVYTLFFLSLSFVIFGAENIGEIGEYYRNMFGFGKLPLISAETLYYFKSYIILLAASVLGATPVLAKAAKRISKGRKGSAFLNIMEPVVLTVLLLVVTAYLVDGSYSPFLYFRF